MTVTHATLLATGTLSAVALSAAISDVATRRVSNRLNLVIFALGLGWRTLSAGTALSAVTAVALGFAGAAVGLAVLLPLFAARWIGAGDVKLIAAFGAWLGPVGVLYATGFGLAGGGVLAAAIALLAGAPMRRAVARNVAASLLTMTAPVAPTRAKRLTVPLAVPLAAAAVATFAVRGLI